MGNLTRLFSFFFFFFSLVLFPIVTLGSSSQNELLSVRFNKRKRRINMKPIDGKKFPFKNQGKHNGEKGKRVEVIKQIFRRQHFCYESDRIKFCTLPHTHIYNKNVYFTDTYICADFLLKSKKNSQKKGRRSFFLLSSASFLFFRNVHRVFLR